jgi:hypothetical protein
MSPDHLRRFISKLLHLERIAVRIISFDDVAADTVSELHYTLIPLLDPPAGCPTFRAFSKRGIPPSYPLDLCDEVLAGLRRVKDFFVRGRKF